MTDTDWYLDAEDVTVVRLINEDHVAEDFDWALDGTNEAGTKYTDFIDGFPDEESAVAAIPEFCKQNGIKQGLPIRRFIV